VYNVGTNKTLSKTAFTGFGEFIGRIYQLQTSVLKVTNFHWWVFKRKQELSERLPHIPDALHRAIYEHTII